MFCCVIFLKDWDKPQHIPDPDAKKPDDWDDEIDGEWEPPMIDNPDYKVGAIRLHIDLNSFKIRVEGHENLSCVVFTSDIVQLSN